MFHHFPDELNGTVDYLVRSTELDYQERRSPHSSSRSHRRATRSSADGSYLKKSLPKLEFEYTEVEIDETVRDVDPESLRTCPTASMAATIDGSISTAKA